MVVEFLDPSFTRGLNIPDTVPPDFYLIVNLPKQMSAAVQQAVDDGASSSAQIYQIMAVTNVAISTATSGSLQYFWNEMNSLTLMVHLPLLNRALP